MKNQAHKKDPDYQSVDFSEELVRTVFDALSAHMVVLNDNGVILETNQAWKKHSMANGMPEDYDYKGLNYLKICDLVTGPEADDVADIAAGIRAVINGEVDEFLLDYPCHTPDRQYWYYMRVIRISDQKPIRVVVSHENITDLKLTEEALRESRAALEEQKQSLEEANIALKVILKQRDDDKDELENKVLTNIKDNVFPYLEKLKHSRLKSKDRTLVEIIETHLNEVISPLLQNFANAKILLTPQEMQVAGLVKDGKSSKEIADILNVSEATINFHRKNLRVKFGLTNQKTNLRSYLISIS